MKIAITGATGDIGNSYMHSISSENSIHVLARKGSRVPHEDAKVFSFTDGFIYETSLLEDFAATDILVHSAALLNSDDYTLSEVMAVNAMLTAAIVISAERKNVSKIIYISTEMVYGLDNNDPLKELLSKFRLFCKEYFFTRKGVYDLKAAAQTFLEANSDFPFEKYNNYALAKYLGEAIVSDTDNSAILRITSAYGPCYQKPRLIPRLIQARLTGHPIDYAGEERNFVYSRDINTLINTLITQDLKGVVDCKSDETTKTKDVAEMIINATPTAYGELALTSYTTKQKTQSIPPAAVGLASIITPTPFKEGFAETLRWHKEQTYHQMKDKRSLEDFLRPDERIIKILKGSSAAHLCVVKGSDNIHKVRKIAVYDGVEGNGIAKVANEIKYYKYISEHKPSLAAMYPKLLDETTSETFSAETIEYLSGNNFYQVIKDGQLPNSVYIESLKRFINNLSSYVLKDCQPSLAPYDHLDAYYVERSFSRLRPIHTILDIEDEITINGRRYTAPHIILNDLLHNKQLRELIKPRSEAFCFHGDLTLLNTVFIDETQNIKLIDPRGHIGNWDPLYDYAKLQFTLGGFGEFVVSDKPMVTQGEDGNFTINFHQIPEISRFLHDTFLDILEADPTFNKKIVSREPHWRKRMLFAKATHFLADIPFRLFTDSTSNTALASYTLGTYYLNEAYETLKNETITR